MTTVRIDHPHNEASALLGIQSRAVLRARGWELGFWVASDERPGHEAVAALGRRADGTWEVVPLTPDAARGKKPKRTEDAETLARAGTWVYVLGSSFGAKGGPLEPRRHFVARFNEALVRAGKRGLGARIEVARRPFLLHRLVNDALRERKLALLRPGPGARRAFVHAPLARAKKQGKAWAGLLHADDVPINIEGSTFLPGGRLLLGLRYPVTREGHPVLVQLEGLDRLFEAGGAPEVVGVHVVAGAGSPAAPEGVRELDTLGDFLHLVTGALDSKPEKSALLADHPEAAAARNAHWVVELAHGALPEGALSARLVRRFDARATVEGLALEGPRVWYAHDDTHIRLECHPWRPPARRAAQRAGPRPRSSDR